MAKKKPGFVSYAWLTDVSHLICVPFFCCFKPFIIFWMPEQRTYFSIGSFSTWKFPKSILWSKVSYNWFFSSNQIPWTTICTAFHTFFFFFQLQWRWITLCQEIIEENGIEFVFISALIPDTSKRNDYRYPKLTVNVLSFV